MRHSNLPVLPVRVFHRDMTLSIEKIRDIPPLSTRLLIQSMLVIRPEEIINRKTGDNAYEVHLWFIFFIKFCSDKDPVFTKEHIQFLNKRLEKIKRYLQVRFGTRDCIYDDTHVLKYCLKDKGTITLTGHIAQITRDMHNETLQSMMEIISPNKRLIYLFRLFCKSIDPYMKEIAEHSITGFLFWNFENAAHNYGEGLRSFARYFIEGRITD
jgi:hypothetical protein